MIKYNAIMKKTDLLDSDYKTELSFSGPSTINHEASKESDTYRGVVNNLFFSHPTLIRFADQPINRKSWLSGGYCNIHDFLIAHKLPEPI